MQTLAPAWNLNNTATAKWYVRVFPSLNDIAFLLPIFVLFARMNGTQLLLSDGDTGWHIRTGEWILAHHAVPTTDLFSFTKAKDAWFAWEWGWDVLAALVHRSMGLGGVAFFSTLFLGLFTLMVYRLSLRVSHNNVMSIVVTALAAAVSSIHWLARPHLVSWIFTLVFLNALESARTGVNSRYLLTILLPAVAMIWTNMHGGFVAGLIIVACYGLGEALTSILGSNSFETPSGTTHRGGSIPACASPTLESFGDRLRLAWKASAIYWQSLALCAVATLANPYGWQLHKHIFSYLTDSELLNNIQEFQSISFHSGPALYLEIILIVGLFAAFQNLQARQFTPVLLICLWAHFALVSARHIPLFVTVAAPFAAATLSSGIQHGTKIPAVHDLSRTLSDISRDLACIELTPRLHVISAAGLVLVAGLFALGQAPFAPCFNPEAFPAQAVAILESRPGSRIFTTDQWGDYLLYRFYPAQKVFFDGRSDFYGDEFVKINQRLAAAEHDWMSLIESYSIDTVMVKPESPLSAVLKLTPGSKTLFDDGKVIVFDTSRMLKPSSTRILRQGDVTNRVPSLSPLMQLPADQVVPTMNRPKKS